MIVSELQDLSASRQFYITIQEMTLFKERRNLDVSSLWGMTPCRLQKKPMTLRMSLIPPSSGYTHSKYS